MSEGWHSAGSSHGSAGEDRFAEKEDVTPAGSHFLRTAYKLQCFVLRSVPFSKHVVLVAVLLLMFSVCDIFLFPKV